MATPRWTLGHWRGGSLTHLVFNICCACIILTRRLPGALWWGRIVWQSYLRGKLVCKIRTKNLPTQHGCSSLLCHSPQRKKKEKKNKEQRKIKKENHTSKAPEKYQLLLSPVLGIMLWIHKNVTGISEN